MPDHLPLPPPVPLASRRIRRGPRASVRNPRQHGEGLATELAVSVKRAQSIKIIEGVDPALVFRIRVTGRLSAEDWRRRGLELLAEGEDWDYVVLSAGSDSPAVTRELAAYARAPDEEGAKAPLSSFFGELEAIEPYGPEDRLAAGVANTRDRTPGPVDIVIWAAADEREASHRVEQVIAAAESVQGVVTASDRRPRSPVVRAVLDGAGTRALASVPVVETIRLPVLPYVDPSAWRDARLADLDVQRGSGTPVGVLDDAIATAHPLLHGLVTATASFPAGRAWEQLGEHGTMVAGLAAYGDFEQPLRDGSPLRAGGPLVQGRVIEPDPNRQGRYRFAPEQPEYMTIEEAIVALHEQHGVRVFVLCVTESDPYSGPRVSLMTERLDDLVRERDLVVVLATGNHEANLATATMRSGDHAMNDYPSYALHELARISEPATAALAVSVGSIARSAGPATLAGTTPLGSHAIAPVDGLSPFSRSGPGAHRGIKPDLVDYGGNWVLRPSGEIAFPESGTSVVSLMLHGTGRLFGCGSGTSYAAPRIARLAADILGAYGDASANLVRALLALSAGIPAPVTQAFGADASRVAGHGLSHGERAIASSATRAVLMGDFMMPTDTVAIHPLPVPGAFGSGRAPRTIRVTLAFDPPVRRTRREYLAGEMSFDLLRASSLQEVSDWYRQQDPEEPLRLPGDRRRVDLRPGTNTGANSTLIAREVRRTLFPEDDGDTYYLAVTHRNRPWASSGEQRYALAVAFEEEERQNIDLYAELQTRVRPRVRVRR
jgi:subtilisin family serine protease